MELSDFDLLIQSPAFVNFVQSAEIPGLSADVRFLERIGSYRDKFATWLKDDMEKENEPSDTAQLRQFQAEAVAIVFEFMLNDEEQREVEMWPSYRQLMQDYRPLSPLKPAVTSPSFYDGTDESVPPSLRAVFPATNKTVEHHHSRLLSILRLSAPPLEDFIVLPPTRTLTRHLALHASRDALLAHLLLSTSFAAGHEGNEGPALLGDSTTNTTVPLSIADLSPGSLFRVPAALVRSHLQHVVVPQFMSTVAAPTLSTFETLAAWTMGAMFLAAAALWMVLVAVQGWPRGVAAVGAGALGGGAGVWLGMAAGRVWLFGGDNTGSAATGSGRIAAREGKGDEVVEQWGSDVRARIRSEIVHGGTVAATAAGLLAAVVGGQTVRTAMGI
ncbi:hypothetical protein BC828DRAFT_377619 [Blastocladiella britannica]|nr:hypothetical protein BC828DRAFT_377619 [Blastocladiella britannica]